MSSKYAIWPWVIIGLMLFAPGCSKHSLGQASGDGFAMKAPAYPHVLRISVFSTLASLLIDYYVTYESMMVVAASYGREPETLGTYSRDLTEAERLRWRAYIEKFPAGELSPEYDNPHVYDGESRIYYFDVGSVKREVHARNASHELLDSLCNEVNRLLPGNWAVGRVPASLLSRPARSR